MADNTLQFRWIVIYKDNLEMLFRDEEVFVAGDLLWYPVEGDPKTRSAPDAMVAFGRPKGERGSYKQWEEGGVAPQVVVEVLSPGNRAADLRRKFEIYNRFGVEEYYVHDPDRNTLAVYLRNPETGHLATVEFGDEWVSPRLGVRFEIVEPEIRVFYPDRRPFLTFIELGRRYEESEARAERERARAERERAKAEMERTESEKARSKAERLETRLRELGIDPDKEDDE